MKRLFAMVAVLLLALLVPAQMVAQQSKAEQQVLDLENVQYQALLKGDSATLGKNLADDFIVIGPDGRVNNKAGVLEAQRSGNVRYASIEQLEAKVRVYGNTAVMTATEKATRQMFGHSFDTQYRSTYVFVKRDGRWLVVLRQQTPILPPQAGAGAK